MNFAGSAFGFGTKHSLSVDLYCSGEEYEQTIEGESFLVKPGTVLGSKLPIKKWKKKKRKKKKKRIVYIINGKKLIVK